KGSTDRVKTDKRDAIRLARLHRAGELTAIRVPTRAEEAVRDLVRARADVLDDRKRMQQRLSAVLLRHGRIWRGGSTWTLAHRAWIGQQVFDEPALNRVLGAYRGGLAAREAELAAVDAELDRGVTAPPLATAVARLGAYRGIARLTGVTLAAEVVDWRRFATARAVMGFSGLIPSEYSSGERTRRGRITKAGPVGARTALIEAAWAYQHRPGIGVTRTPPRGPRRSATPAARPPGARAGSAPPSGRRRRLAGSSRTRPARAGHPRAETRCGSHRSRTPPRAGRTG
ncbi:MAG: IS110 family transposase, partial [Pseudonocardiaceae bacterium]